MMAPGIRVAVLGLVAVALIAAACSKVNSVDSSTEARPTSGPGDNGGELGELLPSEALIADTSGYSVGEIDRAVDLARRDHILRCAADLGIDAAGFEVVLALGAESSPPPPRFGGAVAMFERAIADRGSEDESAVSEGFDERQVEQIGGCIDGATKAVPDPMGPVELWLQAQADDLEASVIADSRIVDAQAALRECIRKAGYEADNTDQLSSQVWNEGFRVVESYELGEISQEAAMGQLASLKDYEVQVGRDVIPCLDAQLGVEREVRIEVERAFLLENGDALALIAREAAETIQDRLASYLPDR